MGFHNWIGCFQHELMFDVAPAFPNNPKDNDGEIQVTLTDAFQVKGDLFNVLELSFCPWKSTEEVCSFFLSLCFGRLWFSNEVDDLKEAQYSEELREVVDLRSAGFEIV